MFGVFYVFDGLKWKNKMLKKEVIINSFLAIKSSTRYTYRILNIQSYTSATYFYRWNGTHLVTSIFSNKFWTTHFPLRYTIYKLCAKSCISKLLKKFNIEQKQISIPLKLTWNPTPIEDFLSKKLILTLNCLIYSLFLAFTYAWFGPTYKYLLHIVSKKSLN